jgi:hypothetical protein
MNIGPRARQWQPGSKERRRRRDRGRDRGRPVHACPQCHRSRTFFSSSLRGALSAAVAKSFDSLLKQLPLSPSLCDCVRRPFCVPYPRRRSKKGGRWSW